jgi:hypothetical protein
VRLAAVMLQLAAHQLLMLAGLVTALRPHWVHRLQAQAVDRRSCARHLCCCKRSHSVTASASSHTLQAKPTFTCSVGEVQQSHVRIANLLSIADQAAHGDTLLRALSA